MYCRGFLILHVWGQAQQDNTGVRPGDYSEFTPELHSRISITVSGEQLPFGQSILQIGCQELKSSGNSSSQTRTHPLSGREGGVWEILAGLQTEMSGCNPEFWMLNELRRKGEGRVMNSRAYLGEGHRKNSLGNAAAEAFFFPRSLLFHCCFLEQKQPMQRQGLKTKRPDTYFLVSVSNISCHIYNSYTINRNAWTQSSFPGFSENDILFLLASFPHLSVLNAGCLPFPTIVLVLFSSSHSLTFGNLCPPIWSEPKCHL